jgi:hypothetical protein
MAISVASNRAELLMREDVADLADRMHLAARRLDPVEQRRFRRRNREVAAIAGAMEGLAALAEEGPGNDAADIERIEDDPHFLAEIEQPAQAEGHLMRGDLEDGVR